MRKLTLAYIQKIVRSNDKLEPIIDLDEPGKAILYTREGWTWCALDGDRTVAGFVYSDVALDERDTVAEFHRQLKLIEPVVAA